LNRQHYRAWTNLLVLFDEDERCDKAIELIDQLGVDHQMAPLHYASGCCLGKLGHFARAEYHFQLAIDLDPDNPNYYSNLGMSLIGFDIDEQVYYTIVGRNRPWPRMRTGDR
jgi:Flp pilus assembly protein TadD